MNCVLATVGSLVIYLGVFSQKVAIIGGGMAGVSASHHILAAHAEADITIFEKEAVMGGNAQTVSVPNAEGKLVKVDAGPQYFTEGPWDEYIAFLKLYGEYDEYQTMEFGGSIIIEKQGIKKPRFITPLKSSLRGEKISNLLKFKRFFDEAYRIYQNPESNYAKSIGDWVNGLSFTEEFKQDILLPFLASSLGTTVPDIQKTATLEIVKLFAFRKPSLKNKFKVMTEGMGTLIANIAKKQETKGITVRVSSPVKGIRRNGVSFDVLYTDKSGDKKENFDFVVFAVHADQAYWLLKDDTSFADMATTLQTFKYFKAHIVLHGDASVVNLNRSAFMNIHTDSGNQLLSNTMNLGMITPNFSGIYKSWLSDEMTVKIKAGGKFYHEVTFSHPLITPEFNAALEALHKQSEAEKAIFFAGGWSQGLETQETAVISGQKAAEKFLRFIKK